MRSENKVLLDFRGVDLFNSVMGYSDDSLGSIFEIVFRSGCLYSISFFLQSFLSFTLFLNLYVIQLQMYWMLVGTSWAWNYTFCLMPSRKFTNILAIIDSLERHPRKGGSQYTFSKNRIKNGTPTTRTELVKALLDQRVRTNIVGKVHLYHRHREQNSFLIWIERPETGNRTIQSTLSNEIPTE